ncbi:MAG: hypothetical protein QOH63_1972 [Acidobacteriota bacterium]|jgi:hypothetical protein|nr:hypothetical protein [Acidobacteriota bacterium]
MSIQIKLEGGAFDGLTYTAKAGCAELLLETLSPSPYGIPLPDDKATLRHAIRKGTHPLHAATSRYHTRRTGKQELLTRPYDQTTTAI